MRSPNDARQWPLLLASTLTVMAGAALAPALPTLQAAFHDTPHADVLTRQLLTVPALFIVLAAPIAGWLVDRVGRVRLLAASILLYVLAGSVGGLLDRLDAILVSRALLGVAVAGIMTSVTTLIADYFDGVTREQVFGRQGAFMSFGGVVFLIGGGLAADVHWRATFLVYTVPVMLLWWAARLPEPLVRQPLSMAVTQRLPRVKVGLIYGAGLTGMMMFYVIPVQLPYRLVEISGANGTVTGFTIALSNVAGTIAGLSFARLRRHLQPLHIVTLVYVLMASGYVLIGLAQHIPMVLAGLALSGFGLGLTVPNLSTWLSSFTPPEMRGRMMGGLTAAVFIGQFVSPLVAQPFVDAHGTAGPFLAAAVLLTLLAGLAWGLRNRA
ncbi:MFS transporter [Polycyclovorans algicola]|uniref:MFS transporter n=1 Tax=Polycyclovorans algicola TaxID=616992 RepID=UPI000A06E6DE|nr:MFS transporter [Polycyclovorans algicola]